MDTIDRQIKAIDKHNARLRESNAKSCEHELTETFKEVRNKHFRGQVSFLVTNPFHKGKATSISITLWRLQNYLEGRYRFISAIFSFLRRTKLKLKRVVGR